MKADEKRLLEELRARTNPPDFPYVRDLVHELGIPEKRAAYVCEKWTSKGWYDYGVNVLAGWLTEEGTMKHYGLKQKGTDGWLRDQSGMIFWTTSKAVAHEQLKIFSDILPDDFEVCEFIDDQKTEQGIYDY